MSNRIEMLRQEYLDKYTQLIKRNLPEVLKSMKSVHSVYRYLVVDRPVVADGQLPAIAHQMMKAHNNSPAFTNQDYVAFSSENLALLMVDVAEKEAEELVEQSNDGSVDLETCFKNRLEWRYSAGDARTETRSVLAHEYTHILCEHARFSLRFASKKHTRKDFILWQYAMEIQANDAIDLDHSTACYKAGFTRSLAGDVLNNCWTLSAIYKALKNDKKLSDKINQQHEQHKQDDNDQQTENGDNGNDGNDGNNNQQTENGGNDNDGNDGDKTQSNATDDRKANKTDNMSDAISRVAKSVDENIEEAEYQAEQQVFDDSGHDDDDDGNDYDDNDEKQRVTSRTVEHDRNGNDEADVDVEQIAEQNVRELAEKYNDRQISKRLHKQFAKLRQTIKGNMSKNKIKTYSRPSRRGSYNGLFRKGSKRDTRSVPKVLVALDCSGSMSSAKVTSIANTIGTIVNELGRSTKGSYICLHDDEIKCLVSLDKWRVVVEQYYACGGNNFDRVYKKALDLGVDVVLNVGDGVDYLHGNDKKLTWYDVIVDYDEYYYDERAIQGCNDANNKARIPIIVDKRV